MLGEKSLSESVYFRLTTRGSRGAVGFFILDPKFRRAAADDLMKGFAELSRGGLREKAGNSFQRSKANAASFMESFLSVLPFRTVKDLLL